MFVIPECKPGLDLRTLQFNAAVLTGWDHKLNPESLEEKIEQKLTVARFCKE